MPCLSLFQSLIFSWNNLSIGDIYFFFQSKQEEKILFIITKFSNIIHGWYENKVTGEEILNCYWQVWSFRTLQLVVSRQEVGGFLLGSGLCPLPHVWPPLQTAPEIQRRNWALLPTPQVVYPVENWIKLNISLKR